jgi:LDH2 family malate/lactate/ureidoglycolate dehydrogenase
MAGDAAALHRVDAGSLRELSDAIYRGCGMSAADAGLLADTLVAADLRGVHSHGVMRTPEYVRKLLVGGVDPRGRPRVVRDADAALVVDGGNAMGQVAASFAMERALDRAETIGAAAVAVRGSNHCGALAWFAMQALPRDMIGLATTNALPVMAPWGGMERVLGINPLGIAIPAGDEPPIVYDAAFSASAHGKIRVYKQRGLPLPEGWALDAAGQPTIDPAAAIDGLLLPIGGFKGAGLSLIMGLLSSMLSGAAFGRELGDLERGPDPGRDGHFLLAIKIAAFEDVGRFKRRVDAAIRELRGARLAPGFDRIYAPGEKEVETELAYRIEGIPLDGETLAGLRWAAQEVGEAADRFPWLQEERPTPVA